MLGFLFRKERERLVAEIHKLNVKLDGARYSENVAENRLHDYKQASKLKIEKLNRRIDKLENNLRARDDMHGKEIYFNDQGGVCYK